MSYKFPIINKLDDLLSHIEGKDYLVASKKNNGTTGVCYIYTDKDSFANEWERECRGITFDRDGNIASRTLHKFFNLNEREAYDAKNIDFSKVKAIYPKLDGSMISTYVLDNAVVGKSKNSEESDVAVKATNYINSRSEYVRFCTDLYNAGKTPTFEYTAPDNRIVLDYKTEELTLLQVRDNVTGAYLDIDAEAEGYDVIVNKVAYDKTKDIMELVREMETMTGIEGFIIMFEDGDMVKIKTPWYIGLHHSVTFTRYRDVAKLVCTQKLDDFRALVITGKYDGIDMSVIDSIEHEIMSYINDVKHTVSIYTTELKSLYSIGDSVDFKSCSSHLGKNLSKDEKHLFVFIMNALRGKETDYLEFYYRNILKVKWGLEQIPAPK